MREDSLNSRSTEGRSHTHTHTHKQCIVLLTDCVHTHTPSQVGACCVWTVHSWYRVCGADPVIRGNTGPGACGEVGG